MLSSMSATSSPVVEPIGCPTESPAGVAHQLCERRQVVVSGAHVDALEAGELEHVLETSGGEPLEVVGLLVLLPDERHRHEHTVRRANDAVQLAQHRERVWDVLQYLRRQRGVEAGIGVRQSIR